MRTVPNSRRSESTASQSNDCSSVVVPLEMEASGVAMEDGDADQGDFVLAEEAVFGYEAVTGYADFACGTGVQVVQPIGVGAPGRADHDLAAVGVVSEHHGHRVVQPAGLATDVYQQEEGPAQHPAPTAAIEP